MRTWWRGVALLACGIAGTASAQAPSWPGTGGMPPTNEPIPYSASPLRNPAPSMAASVGAVPPGQQMNHAMPAAACPPGQDSPNSLPANLDNAWSCDNEEEPCRIYVGLGFLAMMRQRLGHGVAAVIDNAAGGVDTGDSPPPNAPIAARFSDIDQRFNYGPRFTIGYHSCDRCAIEASGFYLAQNSSSKVLVDPGRLSTFFNVDGSFLSAPLGFEGDNGMWLQADIMRIQERTALGSGELNYRWWIGQDSGFSWLLGVRYIDFYDRFLFFTGDDDLTVVDINGRPDPTRQATYTSTAHNRLVAGQLGLEWDKAINCWLAFTLTAKGAWGGNFLDVNTLLTRGDGFVGFNNHRSETIFSHMYELGAFLDFSLMDNCRVRAGYNLFWMVDIATALGQFDFNLANQFGQTNNHGSAFYHGPSVELQIIF